MSNHTQKAKSGESTFTSNTDRTTGVHFPADGQIDLRAADIEMLLATATGIKFGPAGYMGIALAAANRMFKMVEVDLAALDTGGGVLSWVNPEGATIYAGLVLDITTVATGACTVAFGETAVSGTTSAAGLYQALDVHSATGVFTPIAANRGTGLPLQKVPSGAWITGSKASGAAAGLVGKAYIFYFLQ